MTPRQIAINAIVEVSGVALATLRGNAVIDALEAEGYIIVRNEEPSELGFSCQICGCEFKP